MIELNEVNIDPAEEPVPPSNNTATEKQVAFIAKLRDRKDLTFADGAGQGLIDTGRELWKLREFTKARASEVIGGLLDLPDMPIESPEGEAVELDGMHKFDGTIYKVQRAVHGSGHLYAKALVEDGSGGWTFKYAPGAIRNLTGRTKLSLDEAKEFGVLTGTCVFCARELTDERSIEAGYGPVCADKNGLPWG